MNGLCGNSQTPTSTMFYVLIILLLKKFILADGNYPKIVRNRGGSQRLTNKLLCISLITVLVSLVNKSDIPLEIILPQLKKQKCISFLGFVNSV